MILNLHHLKQYRTHTELAEFNTDYILQLHPPMALDALTDYVTSKRFREKDSLVKVLFVGAKIIYWSSVND